MPEIEGIRKAGEVGRKGTGRYIWHACVCCGKERWAQLRWGKPNDENQKLKVEMGKLKKELTSKKDK